MATGRVEEAKQCLNAVDVGACIASKVGEDALFEVLERAVFYSDEANRLGSTMPDAERAVLLGDVSGTKMGSVAISSNKPAVVDAAGSDNQKMQQGLYAAYVVTLCKDYLRVKSSGLESGGPEPSEANYYLARGLDLSGDSYAALIHYRSVIPLFASAAGADGTENSDLLMLTRQLSECCAKIKDQYNIEDLFKRDLANLVAGAGAGDDN